MYFRLNLLIYQFAKIFVEKTNSQTSENVSSWDYSCSKRLLLPNQREYSCNFLDGTSDFKDLANASVRFQEKNTYVSDVEFFEHFTCHRHSLKTVSRSFLLRICKNPTYAGVPVAQRRKLGLQQSRASFPSRIASQ
jgi:hypothetical protein